jgi:predicted ATPase
VLGQEPGGEDWIETLPRRGYRFIGPAMRELEAGLSRGTPAMRCLPQTVPESSVEDTPGSWEAADSRPHPMVGRDAPLEVLDRIMQRVLTGRRQIALVTGEAGIGKTAFIETALARLSQQGVDLLCGCCTERFGNDEAFLPLIDALITRCRAADGGKLLTFVRAYAPTWLVHIAGHISPAERAAFQHEMFGATRERMLLEFCDLLQALSAARPWALVLEDLHWSDFSTLDVISRFARGTDKVRVLVLGSYRPADSAIGDHPIRRLHQDLEIHGRCTELRLDRLSRAEVERYLALRFGNDALASTLATSVFERTQGQPLFVSSLLNHYIDKRAIVQTGGAWRLSSEVSISQDRVPNDLVDGF